MSSLTTIARPYARAAFEYADAEKNMAEWSEYLALLAALVQAPELRTALFNPKHSRSARAEVLIQICDKKLSDAARNFVVLLAEGNRLNALPEIAAQFEQLRAEKESTVDVRLIAAQAVPKTEQDAIVKALEKRLKKKVQLNSEIDSELIGGAVIKVGDLVIDGSIKSRLEKLAATLLH